MKTQEQLTRDHGTPAEFSKAVWNAMAELSFDEAMAAIAKYEREWADAPREAA